MNQSAPAPTHGRRKNTLPGFGCAKNRASLTAYYKPVATFVRQRLLDQSEHGEVHELLIQSDDDKPKLEDGVNIVADPRDTLGELRIVYVGPPFYVPGKRWAETGYCLHVVDENGASEIVLEHAWSWIK